MAPTTLPSQPQVPVRSCEMASDLTSDSEFDLVCPLVHSLDRFRCDPFSAISSPGVLHCACILCQDLLPIPAGGRLHVAVLELHYGIVPIPIARRTDIT